MVTVFSLDFSPETRQILFFGTLKCLLRNIISAWFALPSCAGAWSLIFKLFPSWLTSFSILELGMTFIFKSLGAIVILLGK